MIDVVIGTFVYDQVNYGQRWQAFALQNLLEREGWSAVTIDLRKVNGRYNSALAFNDFETQCLRLSSQTAAGIHSVVEDATVALFGGDQLMRYERVRCFDVLSDLFRDKPVGMFGTGGRLIADTPGRVARLKRWHAPCATREPIVGLGTLPVLDPVALLPSDVWQVVATGWLPGGLGSARGPAELLNERGSCVSIKSGAAGAAAQCWRPTPGHIPDPRSVWNIIVRCTSLRTNSYHAAVVALLHGGAPVEWVGDIDDNRITCLASRLALIRRGSVLQPSVETQRRLKHWRAISRHTLRAAMLSLRSCGAICRADAVATAVRAAGGQCQTAGVASALAEAALRAGLPVYAADDGTVGTGVHIRRYSSWSDYAAHAPGSRYIPGTTGVAEIGADEPALVIGRPCVIRGLRLRMSATARQRPILVDFLCRGVPARSSLGDYLGWHWAGTDVRHNLWLAHEDCSARLNPVCLALHPSCHDCPLAHGWFSFADITIGDAWANRGSLFTDGGCSQNVALIRTDEGRLLWQHANLTTISWCGYTALKQRTPPIRELARSPRT